MGSISRFNCFLYLLIILIFCSFLIAQESDKQNIDWLSVGGGIGENKRLSTFVSYTFVGENLYQISVNNNQVFTIFGTPYSDYISSFSFLWGKKVNWKYVFGGVFIGPSLVFALHENGNRNFSPGVNFASQFLFPSNEPVSFGIDVFANLNLHHIFYGVRFAFVFRSFL